MFSVVEFKEGVSVIPTKWMFDYNKKSKWPKVSSEEDLEMLVKTLADPNRDNQWKWTNCRVRRIFKLTIENYERACTIRDEALEKSDFEKTESEREKSQLYRDYEPEEEFEEFEDDEDGNTAGLTKLPLPPPRMIPNSFAGSSQAGTSKENVSCQKKRTLCTDTDNQLPCLSQETFSRKKRKSYSDSHNQFLSSSPGLEAPESEAGRQSCVTDRDILMKLLNKVNRVLNGQRRIEERLDDIEKRLGTSSSIETVELEFELPLRTEKELDELNISLMDDVKMNSLVQYLRKIGGSNESCMVGLILKRLLADELAVKYTWLGSKDKKPFKGLLLNCVVLRSIRCHFPNTTEDAVFKTLAKWLRYAKQRMDRQCLSTEKS